MEKKRHPAPMEADTACMRVLASFFVVLLHLSVEYSGAGMAYTSLSRFCVPLFFILSGCYLLAKEYPIKKLWHKALRLFLQMLSCSALYYLYDLLTGKDLPGLARYLLTEPTHLWYLQAAAALYVLTPALYVFACHAGRKLYLYGLGACFLLGSVATMGIRSGRLPLLGVLIEEKMHLPTALGFIFLFLLGGYFRLHPLSKKALMALSWGFPLGGLCTLGLTLWRSRATGDLDPFWLSFFSPFAMLAGAGAFAAVKLLFTLRQDLFVKEAPARALRELSACTLGVYLFHPFFIQWLGPYLHFPLSPWLGIPLRCGAVYGLTLLAVWAARRVWGRVLHSFR